MTTGDQGERDHALGRREATLEQREKAIAEREAAVSWVESVRGDLDEALNDRAEKLGDVVDANEALVLATLRAQELEEAQRAVNRRQNEFVAMLAHELRNPLAPIGNVAELLSNLKPGQTMPPTLPEILRRQVRHVTRLVDDLLDVARVTQGKVALQREAVDAREIVQQAVDSVRHQADERRQRLEVDLPGEPLVVSGDVVRLVQVVSNLLHNAVKFTDEGGTIAIRARGLPQSAEIVVRDNGRGISPAALPNVFELFVQDERMPGRVDGGLGIGLTVVRQMTEMHGGTVRAESAGLGRGSTFTVVLPRIG